MTTIVINAVSIREGGALVVLRELLTAMMRARPQWRWLLLTNPAAQQQLPPLAGIELHVVPESVLRSWRVRLWYETALPALVRASGADLLFSETNYLPARALSCPTLLLVQHAGHFSPLFSRLTEQQLHGWLPRLFWRLKGRWVKASIRRATRVTVQTAALADAIVADTGIAPGRLQVVAHGPGQMLPAASLPQPPAPGSPLRIGYTTRAGVQKNFSVVLRAVAALHARGCNLQLVLTLNTAVAENREVLEQIHALGLDQCVENHGDLDPAQLAALYRSLHVFVFASLCESFGFPLVEAMACGLPLVVADTASNVELADGAGLLFAADNSEALAERVLQLCSDAMLYRQQAAASLQRGRMFSWDVAGTKMVQLIEACISAGTESP